MVAEMYEIQHYIPVWCEKLNERTPSAVNFAVGLQFGTFSVPFVVYNK